MNPKYLLALLVILGAINLVCAFVRAYKEMPRQPRFWPSIFLGAWAALILMTGGA